MDWAQLFDLATWIKWINNIFSNTGNTIAAAALLVSFATAWTTRKHGRMSVIPAFSVWASYPSEEDPECAITLSNKGFGPAIVTSMTVWNGKKKIEGRFHNMMQRLIEDAFGGYLVEIVYTSSVEKGHAFGTGDDLLLARFIVSPGLAREDIETFSQFMAPLAFTLKFKDIYGRKWVYAIDEFSGYTYRESMLNPWYLWARFIKGRKI
ncbi:hypothetical protein L861_08965 [Litchfieldella anticariensis FP35 = DSM 16096]|uniref:Uncharacterized protein n=1 Tax=Litchfieldella anticariensis (strain DSM 16096 / CECT 5854 / CIP 108499 / LMG 22089 / FP35) TaxID=1121939 RepID=S2LCK9_LITA3|nr:hypothetical protein [Halomonas anticariensis]EPC02481.1 hypothetical protein L861_08965 [Halomonas anticariensis FP35 = DSM 16096]